MNKAMGVGLAALAATAAAFGLVGRRGAPIPTVVAPPGIAAAEDAPPPVPLYGMGFIDDSGYSLSTGFTGEIADRGDLAQVVAANTARADRGIERLEAEIATKRLDPPATTDDLIELCQHQIWIGTLHLSAGRFDEAEAWLQKAAANTSRPGMPPEPAANVRAILGVAALRRGELDNCVACLGPSSCILPIDHAAVHQFPNGSRAAVDRFTSYLVDRPDDLGVRWLLNLAHMTLGEYPAKVPAQYLIPIEEKGTPAGDAIGRFENVANHVGLETRGPNMAGGVAFDDFSGDGLPDLLMTSFDTDLGAALYVNRGDGTFADQTDSAGLRQHVLALNCTHADFDNDGDLDVLLIRGGWENPAPLTLLRNDGGTFTDVTKPAGLDRPIASHSAPWGDFDNDGDLDLFVCGEYLADPNMAGVVGDPKALLAGEAMNRCRLYQNNGDGTFTDVAELAGVANERYAKGAAWGDYDDDGRLDLYVSNMGGPNRLYHNEGDGRFTDEAEFQGVQEPINSFACWFFDFDNDGRLDLFVAGYQAFLGDYVADRLGRPTRPGVERPRLYKNLGEGGFIDVTARVGLDRVYLPMGANFGDLDEDGFPEIYLSTGRPSYAFLTPNVLLKNVGGERFEDVTIRSGTGHLQKGHGVGLADFDADGDLDLFAELGGAIPGDRAHNALFRNPGHGRRSISVRLVGEKSNRSAIGARLTVELNNADGTTRLVHRAIGCGSSYGGNSLTELIGLGDSASIRRIKIDWPASGERQVVEGVEPGAAIEITEGRPGYQRSPPIPPAVAWKAD